MPRHIRARSLSTYHAIACPYEVLVEMFTLPNTEKLKAEMDAGRDVWEEVRLLSCVSLCSD
jgi:hypothetical protein